MKWKWSQSITLGNLRKSILLIHIRWGNPYLHLNVFILLVLKTLFEGWLVDGMSLQRWWLVVNQRKAKIYQISCAKTLLMGICLTHTMSLQKWWLVVIKWKAKFDRPGCGFLWFGLNRFKWCYWLSGFARVNPFLWNESRTSTSCMVAKAWLWFNPLFKHYK